MGKWKAPVAVTVGLAATAAIVGLDVAQVVLSNAAAGFLGSLAGLAAGYLIPSPGDRRDPPAQG